MGARSRSLPAVLASLLITWPFTAGGFEAVPAWGGRFVAGEPTEIGLHFSSPEAGPVLVRVDGSAGRIERELETEAGRAVTVALPAYPGADGWLEVSILPTRGERQEQKVALLPRPGPFRGEAAATDPLPAAGSETVSVLGRELPRTAAGYRPIAALTLAPDALVGLDGAQTEALAEYLARCGTLMIPDAPPELLRAVQATAGCGGQMVVGAAVAVLDRVPPLPGTERLAAALPKGFDAAAAALLLLPYFLIVTGLVVTGRRLGPWLIALPAASVAAYAAALPHTVPPATAVTWAEARVGGGQSRFVTLLRAQGAGREIPPIALPAGAGLPMPGSTTGRIRLAGDGATHLPRPIGLLSYVDYRLEGSAPLPFRLETSPAERGEVRFHNAGGASSPAGWLVTAGQATRFPALAPGQSMVLDREPAVDAPLAPVDPAATGVLLPLSNPLLAWPESPVRGAGWIFVRLAGEP